jgi:hypothetical protein
MIVSEFAIHRFPQLDSTNRLLWDWLGQGVPSGTVIIAQQQTAGQGQFQRRWQSPLGGGYLSLGLRLNLPSNQAMRLTFGSAWGVATVLRQVGIPVALKWPNDLILADRKLGGLLIETKMSHDRIHQAVIGLGLNWSNPVPSIAIALQPYLQEHPQEHPQPGSSQEHRHPQHSSLQHSSPQHSSLQHSSPQHSPDHNTPSPVIKDLVIKDLEQLIDLALQGLRLGCQTWGDLTIPLEQLLPRYEGLLTTMGQWIPIGQLPKGAIDPSYVGTGGIGSSDAKTMGRVVGVAPTGALRVRLEDSFSSVQAPEILLSPGSIRLGYGDLSQKGCPPPEAGDSLEFKC